MSCFKAVELQDKHNLILTFAPTTEFQVGEWIDNFFKQNGYILKSGTPIHGSYEWGNRTMRVLFGSFVKYFKCNTSNEILNDGAVKVTITRATSGMSGGIIGIGQAKTEFERIATELQSF